MCDAVKMWVFAVAVIAASAAALGTSERARAANNESCTVTAATVAFGNFDVYTTPTAVTGTLTGTCTKGNSGAAASISITLNNGLHVQGSGNRAMSCSTCTGAFASDLLQYQLYTSAGLTTIWSGATAVTTANPCPCGGSNVAWGPVTIYGNIFTAVAGGINDSAVGTYGDSVVATLNF